jgi:hypothetical protein
VDLDWLLEPAHFNTRAEVLDRPSPVPSEAGIYGWYFKEAPSAVPLDGTHAHAGCHLLYVGIAPKKPVADTPSRRTLRDRLREHYNLNAEGSTLRLSLGCLLGLELRRISSRKNPGTARRMTFGLEGEAELDAWMADHAFVVWAPTAAAWELEHELLTALALPLNLDANSHGAFHAQLSQIRAEAKARARLLPPIEGAG